MPWQGHNAQILATQVRCSSGAVEALPTMLGPRLLTLRGALEAKRQARQRANDDAVG